MKKKTTQGSCESCVYYSYDEDELVRFMEDRYYNCPYYRLGDEYSVVRKQM